MTPSESHNSGQPKRPRRRGDGQSADSGTSAGSEASGDAEGESAEAQDFPADQQENASRVARQKVPAPQQSKEYWTPTRRRNARPPDITRGGSH